MSELRIGVQYTPAPGERIDDTVAAAREVEAMGYVCFSLPDHLIRFDEGHRAPVPDPFAVLSYLAAGTSTISLGTMTVLDALRLPEQTIRCAVTVQQLSNGRFELGIGAGWQQADLDALDPRITAAEARIVALERTLTLVRQAWPTAGCAPGRVDASTPLVEVLTCGTPAPEVVVAAGAARMLAVAARFADCVALTVPTRARIAGATPTAASVAAQIATARRNRPPAMAAPGFHLQIRSLTVEPPPDPDADWWTVGGSSSQVADALRERVAAGIDYLSICSQDLHQLEWLATHVLPQLKAAT